VKFIVKNIFLYSTSNYGYILKYYLLFFFLSIISIQSIIYKYWVKGKKTLLSLTFQVQIQTKQSQIQNKQSQIQNKQSQIQN